jgi:hypothetical protein
MRKYILKIVVCLAILICCFPATIFAEGRIAEVSKVGGGAPDPIYTVAQLNTAIQNFNPEEDLEIILVKDIVLGNNDCIAIADGAVTINGDNHTITYPGSYTAVAIGAEGSNITIKNLSIISDTAQAIIYVYEDFNLILDNVRASGSGSGFPDYAMLCSLQAYGCNVNITNSYFEGRSAIYIWTSAMKMNISNSTLYSRVDSATLDHAAIMLNYVYTNYAPYPEPYGAEGTQVRVTNSTIEGKDKFNADSYAIINVAPDCKYDCFVEVDHLTTVNGDIYTAVALDENGNLYEEIQDAVDNGETVKILRSTAIDQPIEINGSVVLDSIDNVLPFGRKIKLTSSAGSVININNTGTDGVTIKNLDIYGDNINCENGINVIGEDCNVYLYKVKVADINRYALHVGNSADRAYLNVEECDLTGYAALAVYGENSEANVKNSNLTGINNLPDNGLNDFATVYNGAFLGIIVVRGGSVSAESLENCGKQWIAGSSSGQNLALYLYLDADLDYSSATGIVGLDPADGYQFYVRPGYKQQLNNEGFAASPPAAVPPYTGNPYSEEMICIDYSKQIFLVTYMADGNVVASMRVQENDNVANVPNVPPKAGYVGTWNHNGTNILEDTTIIAVYSKYTPPTGDINIGMLMTVMFMSGLGIITAIVYDKKRKNK